MDYSQPKFVPEMSSDLVPLNDGREAAESLPNRPVLSPPVYALFFARWFEADVSWLLEKN